MNKYNIDDIKFLKELQQELKTQDNDYQASPRFWVIKDYEWVIGNEDYDDGRWDYYYNDGDRTEFKTKQELISFIQEYYVIPDEGLKELLKNEDVTLDELFEYMLDNYNIDGFFGKLFMREESFISSNTMFITKQDATDHLKLNRHHYSSKAHTYAMTAWRSPKVERLWEILENFDWGELDGK